MESTEKYPPYLDEPESRRLEFKEILPKGDQLAKTVIAFANGAGGKIVLGVKDSPREIAGVDEKKIFETEERINNTVFDLCNPVIVPEVYLQSVSGKTLLVVEIFPGSNKPYYLKNTGKHEGTYIRVGSTNRKASIEMIEELERQKRRISFDSLPVYDLTPDDLDLSRFKKEFKKKSGKDIKGDILKNKGLLHSERDKVYPRNAAILLSDSPVRKQYFPYAKIECARFKGSKKNVFLDQLTIEEPIFASIEPCITFIKKNIALGSTIGEIYREDRWEYPLEAVREAVINAVIHRDYSILGSDIKVAIYDDMLEITSPGPLPDLLSFDELGTGRSEIRNRIIAPIFKDMTLVEGWGIGFQQIKDYLKEYPELDLVLQEVGHAFQVQFVKKGTKQALSRDQVGTKQGLSKDQAGTKLKTGKGQSGGRVGAESGPSQGRVKDKKGTKQALSRHQVGTKYLISPEQSKILKACIEPMQLSGLLEELNRSDRTKLKKKIINPLMEKGLLEMTEPDSPKSPTQKYRTTDKGKELIE